MEEERIKTWMEGWKEGVDSVLEYLKEIKGLDFKEDYTSWEKADEYTKLNGETVRRYA